MLVKLYLISCFSSYFWFLTGWEIPGVFWASFCQQLNNLGMLSFCVQTIHIDERLSWPSLRLQSGPHPWLERMPLVSASAKWMVKLKNFTFSVIWWAFMWRSFQFHEVLGHPGASGNGAALGSALTIFIGVKNFHYFSGVNVQPSSGLMPCQYAYVQSLWNKTAYLKIRHCLLSMHIDFLLAVDIKTKNNFFF